MGNGKAYGARGWVWLTGLTLVALLFMPSGTSTATEVPTGEIMVIAAHPDDDIILSAGVIDAAVDAGQDVTVVYLTNGSEYNPTIGTTRQNEGVAAQSLLGMAESDLIFFGYPSTFLDCIKYPASSFPHCDDMDDLDSQVTYASRGLGGDDWHDYRTGSPADFVWANVASDMEALLNTYRPDHIFTHAYWDIHSDHGVTFAAVIEAVDAVSGYDPIVHQGLVHVDDPDYPLAWPNHPPASPAMPHTTPNNSATLTVNATNEWDMLESDTGGELTWDQRETFDVPPSMLNSNAGSNLKYQAIAAHSTQFFDTIGLIQRFIHSDEIFWSYRVGAPEGTIESYSVVEGGSLSVSGHGVLLNDIRGIMPSAFGPSVHPTPLGPLEASLVSGPSHGSLTSWPSDGTFTYVHNGTANYTDSFVYQPKQGSSFGGPTTVTINITPVDDDPIANNDGPYTAEKGGSVNVPSPGVLNNDSDPESLALTAHLVSDVSNGSLSLATDGSFTYTHNGTATTSDSFTYLAQDPGGNESAPATVSITIQDNGQPLAVAVSGPTTGAAGVAQLFVADVSGGEGTRSYAWSARLDGNVVGSSASSAFSFVPADAGAFDIELVVSDSTGQETDSTSLKVLGDIGGSTFSADIIWLADEGITKGCNPPANDLFCPDDRVTRGQMAAFLVRFLGLTDNGGGDLFTDDDGSVFEDNIDKLATAGVTRGCNPPTNDNFCPNDFVTRGQMAAFMVRALGLTDNGGGDLFTDDDGTVFESNIDIFATAGITRGCNPPTNDLYCPNDFVTRGQMAAFLHRADSLS